MLLNEIELFKSVPGELITYLAECFEEIKVKMGVTLLSEGDSGMEPMYLILEGEVDIYKGDNKLSELGKGGIFGERNLVESDKLDFTALTRNECTLLVITKEELLNLMSKHIELINCWVDILNEETREEEKDEVVDALFG